MTAFFVQTDRCISGPFTGVELREAALAGIIGPDAVIAGSKNGPWCPVTEVGLFSEKRAPLPHPPGTHVANYQVRGMSSTFQGPFKLRELIGFAARGMLPADALLRSDCSDTWVRARRYAVIAACLNGELVLTDGEGKIVRRSSVLSKQPKAPEQVAGVKAPIDVAKPVDAGQVAKVPPPPPPQIDNSDKPRKSNRKQQTVQETDSDREPSRLSQTWDRITHPVRESLSSIAGILTRPRVAIQLTCFLLVFAGVASAFSYLKQMSMQQKDAIGDWVCMSTDYGELSFGISLNEDGTCVFFNLNGDSWSGDYEWAERSRNDEGFAQEEPISTVVDQVGPRHQPGPIMPTDGYIRLSGFVKDPPMIDGHPVRDLFLRRDGDELRIGYLTSVHWSSSAKTMEAGWMLATKLQDFRPDVGGELQTLGQEMPVPTAEFAGVQPIHISKAIDAVQEGVRSLANSEPAIVHETFTYSHKVDPGYLLKHFGMPDEARPLFPFEAPKVRTGPSFENAQLVRYGDLKFYFSSEGQLRYLALNVRPSM